MAQIASPDATAFSTALQDPEIERRVRRIVERALQDYEWIMEWGSEAERLSLLKSALPNLLRAMSAKDEQQRNVEQQRVYQGLREAFQANVKVNEVAL